ncbi:hypothetical protein DY000_02023531 [Brassica cretica]|uniref:Cytochrome c domain-containing protein n=1 Tax=Brassica cretica TaxID=69181 RepID=A0ABQ7EKD0_BRACR|nr:hypothetical protein DY000_02023531 [Brassica cretica]
MHSAYTTAPLRKRSSSKNRLRKSSFKKAVAGAYAPIDQEEGESSRQRNKKPCSTCHKSETFKGEKQMNQASIVGQMEKAFRQSMIPLGSAAAESKDYAGTTIDMSSHYASTWQELKNININHYEII